jgi:hypothetical protein
MFFFLLVFSCFENTLIRQLDFECKSDTIKGANGRNWLSAERKPPGCTLTRALLLCGESGAREHTQHNIQHNTQHNIQNTKHNTQLRVLRSFLVLFLLEKELEYAACFGDILAFPKQRIFLRASDSGNLDFKPTNFHATDGCV